MGAVARGPAPIPVSKPLTDKKENEMSKKIEVADGGVTEVVGQVTRRLVDVPRADADVATPFRPKVGVRFGWQEAQDRCAGDDVPVEAVSGL